MLKFKKVEAQNYKSFDKLSLNLQDQGLTLIEGDNKDSDAFESNGVGKSAMLETITYALYDTTANKLRADEVVNRKFGKDTYVKLFFEQNGVSYRIERYRKHKEHKNKVKLYQSGKEITGSTNRVTNQMIEDIIGITPETYWNSIMYGQSSEPLFSEATDKGKKEILENITSISVYAHAQEVAKEKVKEQNLKEQEIEASRTNLENKISNIEESVQREKERYESVRKMIDSRKLDLAEAKKARKEFPQAELRNIKNKVEKLDKPVPEFKADLTYIEQFTTELRDLEAKADEFKQAINQLKATKTSKQQEQSRLDTADVCPTCGTKMSNEHAKKHFQELQLEINQLEETINNYEEQYKMTFVPLLDKAEENLRQANIHLEANRQEHNDEVHQQQMEVQQLKGQVETFERNKEMLDSEVLRAERALKEVESLPKPDERKEEIEEVEEELKALKVEEGQVFVSKTKYEDAVKAFSNSGIRSVVLDLVTPTLTNNANRYLSTLSDSTLQVEFTTQVEKADGELTDKFDVMVTHSGEETTFQTLSQGEKTRVNVAISLALQDLVYSNSQLQTNIALYDEVFDGLDSKGVSSVIDILKSKAEEIGSVFVITHSSTMKPLFEKAITITKEDGISSVEGE